MRLSKGRCQVPLQRVQVEVPSPVRSVEQIPARRRLLEPDLDEDPFANHRFDERLEVLITGDERGLVHVLPVGVCQQVDCDLDIDLLLARPAAAANDNALHDVPPVKRAYLHQLVTLPRQALVARDRILAFSWSGEAIVVEALCEPVTECLVVERQLGSAVDLVAELLEDLPQVAAVDEEVADLPRARVPVSSCRTAWHRLRPPTVPAVGPPRMPPVPGSQGQGWLPHWNYCTTISVVSGKVNGVRPTPAGEGARA